MSKIYDVLIIGNGGAGLSAALEAKKNSDNIAVLSKTYPTTSQTSQAQGGINGVLNDSIEDINKHIFDTIKSSHNIGNIKTIEHMCKNAKETIQWLDDLGVPFSRNSENEIAQRNFGGSSKPRTCYSSDYTGMKILHTLYDTCLKENIEFLNEYLVLNFIKDEESNTIKGINVLNIKNSEISKIFAKSIIIASGGYGGLYHNFTTNSTATTGEVLTAALNIGCELENMEFVQFHPTSLKQNRILISESARGEGGYLVDQHGDRFIDELKPRDEVSRAIYEKITNGDKIYLDLRHIGVKELKELMPQEYNLTYEFTGLKMDESIIEVIPSTHYTMGGIKVDIDTKTNIENLYACGECASSRVHGANRLGGNSLLEIITFGRVAGKNASLNTNNITNFSTEEYEKDFENIKNSLENIFLLPNKINFQEIKTSLGKILFEKVGLFKNETNLQEALRTIKTWENDLSQMGIEDKSKVYNTDLKEFIEFQKMIKLSQIIILSALERKESRGAHYRTDYLNEDPNYDKSTIVIQQNDELKVML